MSVKVRGLVDPGVTGERAKRQRAESLGVWTQVLSWASGERSDGFVTADILDLYGWDAANERLLRAKFEMAPLLHRRADGEKCKCMEGRTWVADFEYLIHDYLDRNPSKSENDVHRTKARELRDSRLKLSVRQRDRDTCRYCLTECRYTDRVGLGGLTFDHVDPEVAAGADNLVVACRGCNNRKKRRTPAQADMRLIPLAEMPWNRQASPDLLQPTCDGPATGLTTRPTTVTSPVASPVTGPNPAPNPRPGETLRPDLQPTQVPSQTQGSPGRDGGRSGTAPEVDPQPSGPPTADLEPAPST
jgi:hypothetical protein